jgi:hypothetical protein
MIRRLLSLTITLAVILAVVGYFRGWFVVSHGDSNSDRFNFSISVDKDKIKDDARKVEDMTRSATTQAKQEVERAADAVQKSRR